MTFGSRRRLPLCARQGAAATEWLHRRAPLHEADAGVKADLEAVGITGLTTVTPASVRCAWRLQKLTLLCYMTVAACIHCMAGSSC